MATPDEPRVEVAYALPQRQVVVEVPLCEGMTAIEALRASGLPEEFPELQAAGLPLGIFGRRVGETEVLRAGDRVEVYRPLAVDPREARRRAVQSERQQRTAQARSRRQGGR
jgi:putative ubiquitin-RnfH superfamily antitoxin RatB of RatAB toxin-antitoxin module